MWTGACSSVAGAAAGDWRGLWQPVAGRTVPRGMSIRVCTTPVTFQLRNPFGLLAGYRV